MSFNRSILALGAALALCVSVQASAADATQSVGSTTPASVAQSVVTEKVNINTATVEELTTIKGVGNTKAQSIIDYRTQHGAFKSVNDLANVKGIGEKSLATLLKNNPDRIVVE